MMPVDGEKESSAPTAVTPKPGRTRRSPAPPCGGAARSTASVMMVTAESGLPAVVQAMAADQQHDESVGVQDPSALRAEPVEAVGRRRGKKARPEARAEFRATADDDGVAQRLPCECEDKGATAEPSSPVRKKKMKKKKKKKKAVRHLRGVRQTASGRFGAQIGHSKTMRWLGTFANVEDAARAYDAAAIELHGARAVTNFKAGGGGVSESSGLARADAPTEVQGVHGQLGGECSAQTWDSKDFDLLDDFPVLPALDFTYSLIPGPLLDDLRTNLPPAERQLVDEFIKDIDFTNW